MEAGARVLGLSVRIGIADRQRPRDPGRLRRGVAAGSWIRYARRSGIAC
jgi:hypothetical protein